MITEKDLEKFYGLAYNMASCKGLLASSSVHSVGRVEFSKQYWDAVKEFDDDFARLSSLANAYDMQKASQ